MNVLDILKYGNQSLLASVEDLPEVVWDTGGVCGVWSVKDIMAHLASYEHLLVEVLCTFLGEDMGPNMREKADTSGNWNDLQVERRRHMTVAEVLAEYTEVYEQARRLAAQIPPNSYRQNGTIPWYGAEYCLEDFIVYSSYGHKREHSAQVNAYRDLLAR